MDILFTNHCSLIQQSSWILFIATLTAFVICYFWCYLERKKSGVPTSATVAFFTFLVFVFLWVLDFALLIGCYTISWISNVVSLLLAVIS